MMTKDERAQAVERLSVLADRVAQERRMCIGCESWDHCERDGCALLQKVMIHILLGLTISDAKMVRGQREERVEDKEP